MNSFNSTNIILSNQNYQGFTLNVNQMKDLVDVLSNIFGSPFLSKKLEEKFVQNGLLENGKEHFQLSYLGYKRNSNEDTEENKLSQIQRQLDIVNSIETYLHNLKSHQEFEKNAIEITQILLKNKNSFSETTQPKSDLGFSNETDQISNRYLLKKKGFITGCPHPNKKHYAKNMCSNCYHSYGRGKKAWKCAHKNKPHYALGVCQGCYQILYCQKKKVEFVDEVAS